MAAAKRFALEPYLTGAHEGGVVGEAFFALRAELAPDATEAEKWRVLERLERHVKTRLAAELSRRGLPVREDPAKVEEGRKIAASFAGLSRERELSIFAEAVRGFVAGFRTAKEQAPPELEGLADFVLRHEEVLLSFLEREQAGHGATSTEPTLAFLAETGAPDEAPLPDGIRLTPLDDAYREDPYPILHELRRRAPVHRDRAFGRYVLTRHEDVLRVLRDLDFWVDARKATDSSYFRRQQVEEMEREPSMLGLDDPEHKRLRNLVSRSFTPRAVAAWQPVVRQVAIELLALVEQSPEDEFDLVEALANPLPAIAIARLLGVDPGRQADFKAWSEASVAAGFNPFASQAEKDAAEKARQALDACFRDEIRRRRAEPRDDLIGRMVTAEEEGDSLTEQEIITMGDLLLVAGNVTTSDLIGNGVKALLENPGELARLKARPELLQNAIEEMLRFDPPVTSSGRIAPFDVEIGGVQIRKGESITTVLAAANRDPSVYPDPDRFLVEREDTHHQSFGGGAHLCLGAHLARLEAEEAIGALIRSFPGLRAADRPWVWKRVPGFRGLSEYWVRKS